MGSVQHVPQSTTFGASFILGRSLSKRPAGLLYSETLNAAYRKIVKVFCSLQLPSFL